MEEVQVFRFQLVKMDTKKMEHYVTQDVKTAILVQDPFVGKIAKVDMTTMELLVFKMLIFMAKDAVVQYLVQSVVIVVSQTTKMMDAHAEKVILTIHLSQRTYKY